MISKIRHYFRVLKNQPYPFRFVLGFILKETGLCRFITFNVHGYKIRFFPTALSFSHFSNPNERNADATYIAKLLKEGDTFVDVGANIGTLTITAAKVIGDKGNVFSFEAHPKTYKYLKENLAINGLNYVKTFGNAVGHEPGEITFSDSKLDDQNCVSPDGGIKVDVRRLDEIVPADLTVDLLKIDTEGFELPVLKSCEKIINNVRVIYFESDESHCINFGYSTKDLIAYLLDRGFKVLACKHDEAKELDYGYISPRRENLFACRDVNSCLELLEVRLVCRS